MKKLNNLEDFLKLHEKLNKMNEKSMSKSIGYLTENYPELERTNGISYNTIKPKYFVSFKDKESLFGLQKETTHGAAKNPWRLWKLTISESGDIIWDKIIKQYNWEEVSL